MRRLLVFQHIPFEVLGTLQVLLKARGFRLRYANFGRYPDARPEIARYNGLVVLGGPMHVGDREQHPHLTVELELIREAIDLGLPVLGICLGAQLIATALGARVYSNQVKEIGWYPVFPTPAAMEDPLINNFGKVEHIFQWHSDTFDLPAGAVHLASSQTCPTQAFRYGTTVYGLQFHLEVDERLIERWLTVPQHRAELAEVRGQINPETIRQETALYIQRSRRLSDQVFGRFIDLFQLPPKRAALRSR